MKFIAYLLQCLTQLVASNNRPKALNFLPSSFAKSPRRPWKGKVLRSSAARTSEEITSRRSEPRNQSVKVLKLFIQTAGLRCAHRRPVRNSRRVFGPSSAASPEQDLGRSPGARMAFLTAPFANIHLPFRARHALRMWRCRTERYGHDHCVGTYKERRYGMISYTIYFGSLNRLKIKKKTRIFINIFISRCIETESAPLGRSKRDALYAGPLFRAHGDPDITGWRAGALGRRPRTRAYTYSTSAACIIHVQSARCPKFWPCGGGRPFPGPTRNPTLVNGHWQPNCAPTFMERDERVWWPELPAASPPLWIFQLNGHFL